ncbi:MAG: 30S ribosomal protein S9 [Planctomycetota bacterium]|nr:MAG: 30S ribosomal protein S9 [Planctomycetota bacterium]
MVKTEEEGPLVDPSVVAAGAKSKAKSSKAKGSAKARKEPRDRKQPDKGGYIWGTGRRKRSVARVRIRPGKGKLLINKKKVDAYFARRQDRDAVIAPLKETDKLKAFDVFVNVRGGGTSGQAGATMLGIARALKNYDEGLLKVLRDGGYLTRDGRMVERKKPGQRGARRRFQFSKR